MKYWYLVISLHVLISMLTFATAYFLSVGGIDMGEILARLPLSDEYISRIEMSGMGHFALGVLFMKLMTPVRFAITMASATMLIKRMQNACVTT